MIKITDADALAKMAQVEGEHWKSYQDDMRAEDNSYRFLGVLNHFRSRKKWPAQSVIGTIYGAGGYNRYFVRGSGEIVFSRGHSINEEATRKAGEVGFTL